jgi:hypothetical protein
MNPLTHLLTGWVVANSAELAPRDRALVTLAGIMPDIDGIGILAEIATEQTSGALFWWSKYHHVLCHNLGFGLLIGFIVFWAATRRWMSTFLALIAFHLHMLGDLIGSRGPDGYQWPIPYLLPFSQNWQLTWKGQWELNAWPNILFTILALATTLYLAWKRGFSPLELVSRKADAALVSALRKKFGEPIRARL